MRANLVPTLRALIDVAQKVLASPAEASTFLPRILEIDDDLRRCSVAPSASAFICLAAVEAIASRPLTQVDIWRYCALARSALAVVRDDLYAAVMREGASCC